MRSKVVGIQKEVDIETKKQYSQFGCDVQFIPEGLSLDEKAEYVINLITYKLSGCR
jgi:hypothetical protein